MSILIVLAKAPIAGRVKTRLCPPLTGEQAADIALAALNDTLRAAAATDVDHRILVLDGEPGDWVPEGFSVLPQRFGLLDQRLIDAFADVYHHVGHLDHPDAAYAMGQRDEPCVLIAMDTPQVHPRQLSDALAALADADSVLGMAQDGGYWLVGLNRPNAEVFRDIPMSLESTGGAQLERLESLGHQVAIVESLRDIDTFDDLDAVATGFAHLEVSKLWTTMQSVLTSR